MIRKIKLWNEEYLLIGDKEGAIATREQYENFDLSYAHLFSNGDIKRYNKKIGTIDDIQFLGVEEDA